MAVDSLNSNLDIVGDYDGVPFLGTVVSNTDPLNLDRVKVRVDGLYDPDKGDVPWCGPRKLSPFGIGGSWGVYGSPAVGSEVLVYLQMGDPHYPVYESIMRTANSNFPSGKSWGFVDPLGNTLKFDLVTKSIKLTTNDGVIFHTDGAGNVSVSNPKKMTFTAGTEVELNAPQLTINAQVTTNGNTHTNGNVSSDGSLTNNGTNVGSTHVHGNVRSGSDNSGGPH